MGTDDRYCHGVIAETGPYRAVAFWQREYDNARGKYDPWSLRTIVVERQEEDAMGVKIWIKAATFQYGRYAGVPDEPSAAWLRSFLHHTACSAFKESA